MVLGQRFGRTDRRRLLCRSSIRFKREPDCENDREPDPPHAHLGMDGWRESSRLGLSVSNISTLRRLSGAGSP